MCNGLILTDVPGFNDIDSHKMKLAEKYTTDCVGVLVVHPFSGSLANSTLSRFVSTSVRQYGASNVIVALTGIDRLDYDPKCCTDEERAKLKELAKELAVAEQIRDSLDDDSGDFEKADQDIQGLEIEQKRIRVFAQTHAMYEELSQTSKKPQDHVLVTYISNTDHEMTSKGYRIRSMIKPVLGPDFDGIKTLRHNWRAAPSRTAFIAAKAHLQRIESYLSRCTAWHTMRETRLQGFKGEKTSERQAMAHSIAKAVEEVRKNIANDVAPRLQDCRQWF